MVPRAPLSVYQLNAVTISAEVRSIERQQPAFAMGEHRRHDIGVVNLPSTNGKFPAQAHQPLGNPGSILKNLKAAKQSADVSKGVVSGYAHRPGLRTCDDGQVLAYDLPADSQRLRVSKRKLQACPSGVVVWRARNTGVHQHVGVNKHGGGYTRSS